MDACAEVILLQCGLEQAGRRALLFFCPPARVEVTVPSNNNKREVHISMGKPYTLVVHQQGSINACTHIEHTFLPLLPPSLSSAGPDFALIF